VLPALQTHTEHRVLVTQDDRLVGIVSPSDVSRVITRLMYADVQGRRLP
jgi:predicted transcriptional regulator